MVVVPLIELLYSATNGMANLKVLPILNLETKILFKLPWRWMNLSFGADRSKYVNVSRDLHVSKKAWVFKLEKSCFLKVMLKRTNRPGISSSNRPPRGARGRGARGTRAFPSFGFRPMRRPR